MRGTGSWARGGASQKEAGSPMKGGRVSREEDGISLARGWGFLRMGGASRKGVVLLNKTFE